MSVPMPPMLVLIVCKVLFVGAPDDNARFTDRRDTKWDLSQGMMHCRRREIALADPAEGAPSNPGGDPHEWAAAPMSFTEAACNRAGLMQGAQFDAAYRDKPWRFWRVACPVPTVNTKTGEIVGWTLPDCGHRDTVICETDSVI